MVAVAGLGLRRGDPGGAFVALRFGAPAGRAERMRVRELLAPADAAPGAPADAALPLADPDAPARFLALPWRPPTDDAELARHRERLDATGALGVDAAWCFQTGTRLVPGAPGKRAAWSHGLPPQARGVRFPLDRYTGAILAEADDALGIALKLVGPALAGEEAVVRAFHALWLAPYGGRCAGAQVVFDRAHHAVRLAVGRFAPPCWREHVVHHLLWIAARLDEVLPVLHARLVDASEAGADAFVLGGNPLAAMYDAGGVAAVDAWLAAQRDWSPEEQARMLCELADGLVTEPAAPGDPAAIVAQLDEEDEGDDEDDEDDDDDDDDDNPGEHADDEDDDDDDDDESEGNEDEDRGRQVTRQAGELLRLRAAASLLDARATEALIPVLTERDADDARRGAAVDVLGAQGDRAAAPALAQVACEDASALGRRAARALQAIVDDPNVN